jgi:ABC-type Mn2+/Zn2+ transport system permease subunit
LVTSFDLHLAKSLGMPVKIIQYGLMVILCLVLTASFESVGVILVISMMILPALSSSFLFARLPMVLLCCLPFSCLYAIGGIHLAHFLNFPISASMTLVGVGFFVPCFLLGPNGGLLFNLRIIQKQSTPQSYTA